MKRLFALMLILLLSEAAFSQAIPEPGPRSRTAEDYRKKAKRQRLAGWLFTTAGSAALAGTLLLNTAEAATAGLVYVFSWGSEEVETTNYTNAYLVSGASLAAGIVFLSLAERNMRLARTTSLHLKMEKAYPYGFQRQAGVRVPSVSVRIALR